jgi:hypothetical protein
LIVTAKSQVRREAWPLEILDTRDPDNPCFWGHLVGDRLAWKWPRATLSSAGVPIDYGGEHRFVSPPQCGDHGRLVFDGLGRRRPRLLLTAHS